MRQGKTSNQEHAMKASQSQSSVPEAQVKAGTEPRTLTLLELTLPCSRAASSQARHLGEKYGR